MSMNVVVLCGLCGCIYYSTNMRARFGCYTPLFYMIIRPELIVLTAGQSTLFTVFKDNFFCVFHFSF